MLAKVALPFINSCAKSLLSFLYEILYFFILFKLLFCNRLLYSFMTLSKNLKFNSLVLQGLLIENVKTFFVHAMLKNDGIGNNKLVNKNIRLFFMFFEC